MCIRDRYGLDCFIVNSPTQRDIDAARAGLEEVTAAIADNHFDMVILDEVCIALYYKLFSVDEVISLLRKKTAEMEIILTGRYAPEELIATADLVTEMREIKHYYSRGVEASKGIEY